MPIGPCVPLLGLPEMVGVVDAVDEALTIVSTAEVVGRTVALDDEVKIPVPVPIDPGPTVELPLPKGAEVLNGPAVVPPVPVGYAVPPVDRAIVELLRAVGPAVVLMTPVLKTPVPDPVAVGLYVADPLVNENGPAEVEAGAADMLVPEMTVAVEMMGQLALGTKVMVSVKVSVTVLVRWPQRKSKPPVKSQLIL